MTLENIPSGPLDTIIAYAAEGPHDARNLTLVSKTTQKGTKDTDNFASIQSGLTLFETIEPPPH